MALPRLAWLSAAALAVAQLANALTVQTHQFDQFFPAWNPIIQATLQTSCNKELDVYKTGNVSVGKSSSSLITPVIDCVLNNTPEFRKSEMAASAVVLGLLPTMIQSLGSSTVEIALLGLRDPILAFVVAAGSPAVLPPRSGSFEEDLKQLAAPATGFAVARRGFFPRRGCAGTVIRVVEYVLALASIANVGTLAYQLGEHAIAVFAPEFVYFVAIWTFLAATIHILGGFLPLWVRLRRQDHGLPFPIHDTASVLHAWNIQPSGNNGKVSVMERIFIFVFWLVDLVIVWRIVFGTLVLSSLLFFSVVDSLNIATRYLGSTIVCQIIVRYELEEMRPSSVKEGTSKEGETSDGANGKQAVKSE